MNTEETGRVSSTVAAEMTGRSRDDTAEMIRKAKGKNSMKEEAETDGGGKNERLPAGEACIEW